ncbi:MAG: hypothetical protein ACEQSH_00140 [Bacteroidia bacterium]
MRYYRIVIEEPEGGKVLREWTTIRAGYTDPAAPDIELDIPVTAYATPQSGAMVRVYGIPMTDVVQGSNFNAKRITVYGGMSKGLPLAIPSQQGLLATGIIQQAFGNWIAPDQTLDIYFTAGSVPQNRNVNLTINWRAGQLLADAIRSTLRTGFPDYPAPRVSISPRLVLPRDQPGFYGTLIQFAVFLKQLSISIINPDLDHPAVPGYTGVDVLLQDRQFIVDDGTTPQTPKPILFTDIIGQITWLSAFQVQMICVMRADRQTGTYITLPASRTPRITTAQSQSQSRPETVWNGVFQIKNVRHTGRFRMPAGTSWVTTIDASFVRGTATNA